MSKVGSLFHYVMAKLGLATCSSPLVTVQEFNKTIRSTQGLYIWLYIHGVNVKATVNRLFKNLQYMNCWPTIFDAPNFIKIQQDLSVTCVQVMNVQRIHSQRQHKISEIWFQDLLHLKKDWNIDVWTQQFTSIAN
jgi:hypothetical protein